MFEISSTHHRSHCANVILVFFQLSTVLLLLIPILISNDNLVEICSRVFPLPETVELSVVTRQNSRDVLGCRPPTILYCVPEKEIQTICLMLAGPVDVRNPKISQQSRYILVGNTRSK